MMLTITEANTCFNLCGHTNTTESEKEFLSYMASLGHAREEITRAEYHRAGRLAGWLLSTDTPIVDRSAQ